MAKTTKKQKGKFTEEPELNGYDKLRLDVLKDLMDLRNIECKSTKEDIVKSLKLDDENKYVRPISYEKHEEGYVVGIDLRDIQHLNEMGRLIEKKNARRLNMYHSDRVFYVSQQKLI